MMTTVPIEYGSDVVIAWLDAAGIEHVALNPGATTRGLHDSLVNAAAPNAVVTLHEEVAVGIAHGYAKSAGKPMAVLVHDLVGLQHASMAIFNAFVDNVPILVLGGSGPRDAALRRPWLDWVHTGLPQAALVREFVKWDDEPASLEALPDVLARGLRIAITRPSGPAYLSIDAGLQESSVGERIFELSALAVPAPVTAPHREVARVGEALAGAQHPVVLVDRPAPGAMQPLVRLAERLALPVVDLGARCSVPSTHWADQSPRQEELLAQADVVVALEVRDLAWGLTATDLRTRGTRPLVSEDAHVISVGLTDLQHRGFLDRESVSRGADTVVSDVAELLTAIDGALPHTLVDASMVQDRRGLLKDQHRAHRAASRERARDATHQIPIAPEHLAASLWEAIKTGPWQLGYGILGGWPRRLWDFVEETSYLGRSGGEGLGYALPASLGAALAHKDDDTLVVDIQPDGDLLYTASALWTAAHHQLPILIVMHNNRSYGKDEQHQAEMAELRGRPLSNVPIGIHLDEPALDFATLARAHGVEGIGPITDPSRLAGVLRKSAHTVRSERRPILVDVVCGRPTAASRARK